MKKFLICTTQVCLLFSFISCNNSKKTDNEIKAKIVKENSSMPVLLTDFEKTANKLTLPYDGNVFAFTDENENPKGTSTIRELVRVNDSTTALNIQFEKGKGAKNSAGYLKISGDVTSVCPYGFVGCGINFKQDKEPIDISRFKGIKFWARGSEDNYVVRIESPLIKDYSFPQCKFFVDNKWEEYIIYFENFRQPSWKSASVKLEEVLKSVISFQWQTDSRPIKNYLLCLDNIEFIK